MTDAEEWLAERLHQFAVQGEAFEPKTLSDPNNKWLVKSAMQKAIRRGNTELALKMASYVFAEDNKDCFRGLAVMVVEDIGPVAPPGLIASSVVSTLTAVRKQFGAEQMYAGMIIAASESKQKTRGCCELGLGVECQEGWDTGLAEMSDDDLLKLWARDQEPELYLPRMIDMYKAGVTLRQRSRNGNDALMERCLRTIMDSHISDEKKIDLMHSFERSVDGMSIAAWPVQWLINRCQGVEAKNDMFTKTEIIRGGLPNYAYDMHTRPGKLALKTLYKQLSKDHDEIATIPWEKGGNALGACLFVLEGGQISNRLRHPSLDQLTEFQDRNFVISRGVDPKNVDAVVSILGENMDKLNELRVWADGKN